MVFITFNYTIDDFLKIFAKNDTPLKNGPVLSMNK